MPERAERTRAGTEPRACDAGMDVARPDPLEETQADLDRGQVEEVERAVLEVRPPLGADWCQSRCTKAADDRAPGEPRPYELGERAPACDQGPHARRANRTTCRTRARRSRGASGRGRDGWSARKRRRRGARPNPGPAPARPTPGGVARPRSSTGRGTRRGCGARRPSRSDSTPTVLVDTQFGRGARHVGCPGATSTGELADAIHRVVVVEREQEAVARLERVGLADEPEARPVAFGVKITTYSAGSAQKNESTALAPAPRARWPPRRRAGGMRVPEDARA